ncbi:MAG: tRNA-specific 2-thiouridylase MnmA [Planctomycetota bacterium]|nr:MAG: tRNA-specific 2-thiouridylase MnmA [Planctomycetota bacterium]
MREVARPGERVVVAMSGGVDSSVAAWLLVQAGCEVIGLFLRNGIEAPAAQAGADGAEAKAGCASGAAGAGGGARQRRLRQGCCSVADAADARRVADALGIPFYALDYSEPFARLIEYFVDSYQRGETPSPCVLCNTWLKFGTLLEFAERLGAVAVATGHYARRLLPSEQARAAGGRLGLLRARDRDKDQSYFLAGLDQHQLARCRFPLGEYTKAEVRALARQAGLKTADKPESMEICFVPGGDYRRLIAARRPGSVRPGEVVDTEGRVLGMHAGYQGYTVGQRRGLGLGGTGRALYVTRVEPATNRVVVGPRNLLARRDLLAERVNWVVEPPEVGEPLRCEAQVRHRHRAAAATARRLADGRVHVRFEAPVEAIAPGQAVVLYRGERVLAGGWIAREPAGTG